MIRILVVLLLVLLPARVWAAMGVEEARHLLGRTGFGASAQQIGEFARLNRAQAVDRLLAQAGTGVRIPVPAALENFTRPEQRPRDMSEEARRAFQREQIRQGIAMRAWWFEEMLTTPSPLTEKMTLFWHNHFVSSHQKVKFGQLMLDQNLLLRRHALGNFGTLLHAVARDPAMVLYLDSAQNRRDAPNENFARELMELFTLGEGQYSERDIKEAARAFTGWSIDRQSGEYRFYRFRHDDGMKTVLGRSGLFDGDEVLDILLARPATAEFLTRKLWREFVSPEPDAAEVRRLAGVLRDARYDIRPWLRAMLASPAFWDTRNRGVLVKSPVEFVVGMVQTLQVQGMDSRVLALASRQLGQDVFAPPNVKGWPGGFAWLTSSTLLARKQVAERLFRASEREAPMMRESGSPGVHAKNLMVQGMQATYVDADRLLENLGRDEAQRRARFVQLALAAPPVNKLPENGDRREFLLALTQDPAFQLK
jgi:uncharacterized protein (DUF1800 family)